MNHADPARRAVSGAGRVQSGCVVVRVPVDVDRGGNAAGWVRRHLSAVQMAALVAVLGAVAGVGSAAAQAMAQARSTGRVAISPRTS